MRRPLVEAACKSRPHAIVQPALNLTSLLFVGQTPCLWNAFSAVRELTLRAGLRGVLTRNERVWDAL